MNIERFVAHRLFRADDSRQKVSRPAVLIAQAGVALGLAVMIVTLCVSIGFKHEVRQKAVGFGSHIRISDALSGGSLDGNAIAVDSTLLSFAASMDGIQSVQPYVTQPGVFHNGDDFKGFMLKGVGEEYDFSFFREFLVAGSASVYDVPDSLDGNHILISNDMATSLSLAVGDRIDAYFFTSQMRARRFTVSGIYDTGFGDFDRLYALTDIATVRSLARMDVAQMTGLEVQLDDYRQLNTKAAELDMLLNAQPAENSYLVQTIEEQNPGLFAWLNVLDTNVWVILALMLGVAGFTVISGLLILILERTQLIGTLKALGSPNASIRRIFLWLSAFIIGRGMLWGNIIGFGLCVVQKLTHVIPLNPRDYYLSAVPIEFHWPLLVLLEVLMMVVSVAMLIGPSHLISRILPSKSIRFE